MKIVIWSRDNCLHCEQAKNYLKVRDIIFEERRIGTEWTREQLLELVPNARTIPQIFIDDQLIGGFTELAHYLETHEN